MKATLAPARASVCTTARPMPRLPPVTSAVLPSSVMFPPIFRFRPFVSDRALRGAAIQHSEQLARGAKLRLVAGRQLRIAVFQVESLEGQSGADGRGAVYRPAPLQGALTAFPVAYLGGHLQG